MFISVDQSKAICMYTIASNNSNNLILLAILFSAKIFGGQFLFAASNLIYIPSSQVLTQDLATAQFH